MMGLPCAHCRRQLRRDDVRVNAPDRTLLWNGQRVLYLTHTGNAPCHRRTIVTEAEYRALERAAGREPGAGLTGAGKMAGISATRR